METIKDTVKNVLRAWKTKKGKPCVYSPEVLLKKLLTEKEIKHIKFNYFKKGILNIIVDSSSWLYQLSLNKDELLANLHKNLKNIKDIRFRLGETQ